MNTQFKEGNVFGANEKQKYAAEECISVPNNGCFNYILEHTMLCRSQGTDKGATHCNWRKEKKRKKRPFSANYNISVYLETETDWQGYGLLSNLNLHAPDYVT